jgi:hypothetical protein
MTAEPTKKERRLIVRVTEHIKGRYEIQEVPFGRVYRWRPGWTAVECDCGKRLTLTGATTACGCGADASTVLREMLGAGWSRDKDLHPWRYAEDCADARYVADGVVDEVD